MAIWRLVARPPILRAAKPDDIPVEQPTKFDLVINRTAARARSRDPAHPLARPDEDQQAKRVAAVLASGWHEPADPACSLQPNWPRHKTLRIWAARRVRWLDPTTPLLQHGFAQPLGVALPGFRKLDDLVRNYIIGNVASIKKPKRYERQFVCKTHDPDCLRVKSLAI